MNANSAIDRHDLELTPGFLCLIGHRGVYVPRKPVLYGQLYELRIARERAALAGETGRHGPSRSEARELGDALDDALAPRPRPIVRRACAYCTKDFEVSRSNPTQQTCSRTCAGHLRARSRKLTNARNRLERNRLPTPEARATQKAQIATALAEVRARVRRMKGQPPE